MHAAVTTEVQECEALLNQIQIWLAGKGVDFAVDLVVAVLILLVGKVLIGLIKKAVISAMDGKVNRSPILVKFSVSVVEKSCWAFLIVTALAKLGLNVGPLIAGLGVTSFILGFAFQESLSNLASGLMIAINEPFKVGNLVRVAGFDGVVSEVNMMATVLLTADNQRITVPNKSVWGAPITNFTIMDQRRVDISVGIAYGADIELARKTALETMRGIGGVLAEPAPVVVVSSLSDSAVALSVRAWVPTAKYGDVVSAGNQAIKEAFDRAGIAIPFPQLDVHLDK